MDNVLILMGNRQNQKMIKEFLSKDFRILSGQNHDELMEFADLVIADGPSLEKYSANFQSWKEMHLPNFLPVLAIVQRKDVHLVTASIWKYVDELIFMPIEKIEVLARIRILLRARSLSAELIDKFEALRLYHYTLAHDLRAHVRAINGFSGIILEDYARQIPVEAAAFTKRIQDVANDMNGLIDAVLKFQKLDNYRPAFKPVELQWLVKKVLGIYEAEIEEKNAAILYDNLEYSVLADPYLLQFVLQNLIGNALKFAQKGERPSIYIAAEKKGLIVRLSVKDNGVGIPKEEQERIFYPLVRLHGNEEYPGYGLGLAVAKRLIQLLEGKIGLNSAPGKGSEFWIELQGDDHENHDH